MMLFWVIAGLSIVLSLFVLARPLFRQTNFYDDNRIQQNIRITKERIKELELELKEKRLSPSDYEQLRDEAEKNLLSDVDLNTNNVPDSSLHMSRSYAISLLIFIPVISTTLYLMLGNPDMINLQQKNMTSTANPHTATKDHDLASVDDMVARLVKRLESDPGNGEGWYMLGRSYLSLGNFREAVHALEKAYQLLGDDPGLLLRYADALAMSHNGKVSGKAFELVQKALRLSPNDPTGLWLAGMGYEEQGKYREAVQSWKKLLTVLTDEQSIQKIRNMIARANSQLGENPVEIDSSTRVFDKGIPVRVDLAAELKNKVSAEATVFIFARVPAASRMPLAVVRKKVKDLPVLVTLNDAMAMTESMRLSQFPTVNIVARLSFSGSAMPQKGDFQSEIQAAQPGQQATVKLVISKQLP